MRYLIALLAMVGILTFTSFVHAAPDANFKKASKAGVLVKVDGKEAKLDDLKQGQSLKLTISSEGVLTKIEATSPKSKS